MFYLNKIILLQATFSTAIPIKPAKPFSLSTSDIISIASAVFSAASAILAYQAVYIGKTLQISSEKFNQIGIQNINVLFDSIFKIIDDNPSDTVSLHVQELTEGLTDLELFYTGLKGLYTRLQLNEISKIKEEFSDDLYKKPSIILKYVRVDFIIFKSKIMAELYEYAIHDKESFSANASRNIKNGFKKAYNGTVYYCKMIWDFIGKR